MELFRNKIFSEEVFEQYVRKMESVNENSLVNNGILTAVNKYATKLADQTGGYAIVEPIMGRIGGDPVNYDGNTNISKGGERGTFYQRKIAYGRAASWGEYDFATEVTAKNFMADAGEIADYWETNRQSTLLSMIAGFFGMTGGVNGQFVTKHTYDITGNDTKTLGADSLNKAAQKALGDKKNKFDVMFTHSYVSTNLEGLNLIDFLKYTDERGVQRDLTIGTFNGKLVVVDDEMPTSTTVTTAPVYSTTISTAATAGDKISINGTEYTFVANDATPEDNEIKVGANGTAAQQAANIVSKISSSVTGFTVTQGSSSNNNKVIFSATSGTNPVAPEVKATKAATTGTLVVTNATDTPAVEVTNYTTYAFQKGFFEYEKLPVVKAYELARDPYTKGGFTDIISRIREIIVPKYISYVGEGAVSPTNSDFATGSNWELVNNAKTGADKLYVNDKLIPIVRIISRG